MKSKSQVNDILFDVIDTEEKAYWLGFIYADGCLSEDSRVGFNLQPTDINHLIKFSNFLECKRKPEIYIRPDNFSKRAQFAFRSKYMYQSLIKLGLHQRKSLNLSFPSKEQIPDKFLYDFIRGYVDGDGSLGKLKKGTHYYPRLSLAGTYEFLDGLYNRTGWKRNTIRKIGNIYVIEWQGKYAKEYAHLLYDNSNVYLDRKYQLIQQMPFK